MYGLFPTESELFVATFCLLKSANSLRSRTLFPNSAQPPSTLEMCAQQPGNSWKTEDDLPVAQVAKELVTTSSNSKQLCAAFAIWRDSCQPSKWENIAFSDERSTLSQ